MVQSAPASTLQRPFGVTVVLPVRRELGRVGRLVRQPGRPLLGERVATASRLDVRGSRVRVMNTHACDGAPTVMALAASGAARGPAAGVRAIS